MTGGPCHCERSEAIWRVIPRITSGITPGSSLANSQSRRDSIPPLRLTSFVLFVASITASGCVARSDADLSRARTRGADIELPFATRAVSARVLAGATLASVLRAHEVAESEIAVIVARAASVFDLRKIRAAQPYRLAHTLAGALRQFEYEIDGDRLLRVSRSVQDEVTFVAGVVPIEKTRAVATIRGSITRETPSLFGAVAAAGEGVDLSLALAGIFNGEIDFNADVQPGDRFELVVEKQYRDDDRVGGYGPIEAAEFENAGRRYRAVRFTPPGGSAGYYDERGVSMRRFFLRSPLKFEPVVSSGFSRNRFHPILREYRAHLGVDYKAPAGAPVVAVADGVVVSAGMSGDAGRLVHLRHANAFESEYLHLSSIAVRAGMRVRQGDFIGRVGSSGLATGSHLDYRVKKNGVFVNPLAAHSAMPAAEPLPAEHMAAFAKAREHAFAELTGVLPTLPYSLLPTP